MRVESIGLATDEGREMRKILNRLLMVGVLAGLVGLVGLSAPASASNAGASPAVASNAWAQQLSSNAWAAPMVPLASTIDYCFGWKSFGWGAFQVCDQNHSGAPFRMAVQMKDTRTDGHCVFAQVDNSTGRHYSKWNCGDGNVTTWWVPNDYTIDPGTGYGRRTPASSGVHGVFF